jgi:hypothetical protein
MAVSEQQLDKRFKWISDRLARLEKILLSPAETLADFSSDRHYHPYYPPWCSGPDNFTKPSLPVKPDVAAELDCVDSKWSAIAAAGVCRRAAAEIRRLRALVPEEKK